MTIRAVGLGVAALATAALALGVLAAGAAASPKELSGVSARLVLQGSHGYRVAVEGTDGLVDVEALSPAGAEAQYRLDGLVSSRRMKANLGRLGFVDVRFAGGVPVSHSRGTGCERETETRERGTFTGRVRFRGEHGFTAVSASRARGTVVRYSARLCPGGDGLHGRGRQALRPLRAHGRGDVAKLRTTYLGAGRRREGRGTGFSFETSALPGESLGAQAAFVDVRTEGDRGRIQIERGAVFEVPAAGLALAGSGAMTTGTVSLPAPFAGEARFSDSADGEPVAWSGDLRVPLPGAPGVALAGRGFHSLLCHGKIGAGPFQSCEDDANSLFFLALVGDP